MNISLSSLFLIVFEIKFWINDYMEQCLFINDEKKRLYSFLFVITTSPPAGIILGGILALSGYDTKKIIYISIIASCFYLYFIKYYSFF